MFKCQENMAPIENMTIRCLDTNKLDLIKIPNAAHITFAHVLLTLTDR